MQLSGQEIYSSPKSIAFMKAMLTARDILLDDLHQISKAINQTIDHTDISSSLSDDKLTGSIIKEDFDSVHSQASEVVGIGTSQVTSEPQTDFQVLFLRSSLPESDCNGTSFSYFRSLFVLLLCRYQAVVLILQVMGCSN